MNYIKHLTAFFDRVVIDKHLNATHISLYMAIFQLWNVNRFKNPISLSRSELMGLSKVSSKTTYHKCLKDLQDYGYLRYEPSFHPLRGSWAYLFNFETSSQVLKTKIWPATGQVMDKHCPAGGHEAYTSSSKNLYGTIFQGPLNIYKHIKLNKLFFLNINEHLLKKEKKDVDKEPKVIDGRNNVLSQKTDRLFHDAVSNGADNKITRPELTNFECVPKNMADVIDFFISCNYPESEGIKFFHYGQAAGWKMNGKYPIENWHSAGHSWMLNINNTSNGRSNKNETGRSRYHSNNDKNYSDPL